MHAYVLERGALGRPAPEVDQRHLPPLLDPGRTVEHLTQVPSAEAVAGGPDGRIVALVVVGVDVDAGFAGSLSDLVCFRRLEAQGLLHHKVMSRFYACHNDRGV